MKVNEHRTYYMGYLNNDLCEPLFGKISPLGNEQLFHAKTFTN